MCESIRKIADVVVGSVRSEFVVLLSGSICGPKTRYVTKANSSVELVRVVGLIFE